MTGKQNEPKHNSNSFKVTAFKGPQIRLLKRLRCPEGAAENTPRGRRSQDLLVKLGSRQHRESFGFVGVRCPAGALDKKSARACAARPEPQLSCNHGSNHRRPFQRPDNICPAPRCPRDIHQVKNVSGALPKQTQAPYGFINYTPFPPNFPPLPSALSIHRPPGDLLTKHPARRSGERRELLLLPSLPAIS